MAKKKNTITPRDQESITPIMDRLHTGNYVKKRCDYDESDPIERKYFCKNWNGDSNQTEQSCPVNQDNFLSCPFLAKAKRRDPLV